MKNLLARKLIVYTIVFSSLITLILTAMQLYTEYDRDVNNVKNQLHQVKTSYTNSIEQAVWVDNSVQLQLLLDGITELPDIAYSEIVSDNAVQTSSGKPVHKNVISFTQPVTHYYNGRIINIGELKVVASLHGVYQRLLNRLWIILVSNTIKTFLVAIFIYILFTRLITWPLSRIAEFAQHDTPDAFDKPLNLNRKKITGDDFDIVTTSINNMRTRLHNLISEIRQQKNYLSLTLTSIGDAVITTNEKGMITQLNPVAEKVTGWTNTDAHDKNLKEVFRIFDASTGKSITNPVDIVLSTGETVYLSNHTTLIAKDGSEHQIADSAAPIYDEDNNILGIVLVFNDVTETYRLREAVRNTQKQLQSLLDDMLTSVIITRADGTLTFANNTPLKLANIALDDVLNKKLWETTWFNYSEATQQVIKHDYEKVAHGEQIHHDIQILTQHGLIWIDLSIHPVINDCGNIIQLVVEGRNISLRKQTEDRLNLALRSSKTGLWDWNIITDQVYFDPLWCQLIGYQPEEIKNHISTLSSLIHPDQVDRIMSKLQAYIRGDSPFYEAEFRMQHKNGQWLWIFARGTIIERDLDDKPTRMIGAMLDISQQKLQEEQLLRSQKMDALDKLTGGIAHDFNNILGVIMGYAEMLGKNTTNADKVSRYASTIHKASQRGANLTRKLLAFTQRAPAESKVTQINTLITEEKDVIQKAITSRIELQLELSNTLWLVKLDSSELADVILNISINAMHAIKNTGTLTIATENISLAEIQAQAIGLGEHEYIRLRITDTGCGITDDIKEKIFDPFFTTKGKQGSGLGLSQTYGFVQRSKGAIQVFSEAGKGSCFEILLPRYQAQDKPVAHQKPNKATPVAKAKNETILVVDDESALSELITEILSSQGYRVYTTTQPEEALAILANTHIDILLSDIIMPKMDGYTLAEKAREIQPNIIIQLTSGYHNEEKASEKHKNLAKNILYKPVTRRALLKRMHKLLKH